MYIKPIHYTIPKSGVTHIQKLAHIKSSVTWKRFGGWHKVFQN